MKNYLIVSILFITVTVSGQKNLLNSKTEINQKTMNTNTENSQTDPESVIKLLIAAMTDNNVEKIRSLFHENASQTYGSGPTKSGKAFFSWLESDIIERQGHVEGAQYKTNGNEVVVTGQYSSKGYTNNANFLFTVKNDKIMSWTMRY